MGTNKRSEISSDRQKWDKIFNGLVRMLQTQQTQLETLVKERKLLEERVRVQHERWVSDIRLYKDHIAQVIYPILQRLFYFILFFQFFIRWVQNWGFRVFGEKK